MVVVASWLLLSETGSSGRKRREGNLVVYTAQRAGEQGNSEGREIVRRADTRDRYSQRSRLLVRKQRRLGQSAVQIPSDLLETLAPCHTAIPIALNRPKPSY